MRLYRSAALVALATAVLLTSGCVTGRRSIELPISEPTTTMVGNKGEFYLDAFQDMRTFENRPQSPSTPSIDGDVSTLTPEQKATFIGRQRGGYGNAMGDVVLANGETVPERMRALVAKGLKSHGYTVGDNAKAANSASVKIDRFWSWTVPEFVMIQFNAQITATVTVNKSGKIIPLTIEASGVNMGQVASDGNYQLAYTRAFDDFLKKLDQSLTDAGV